MHINYFAETNGSKGQFSFLKETLSEITNFIELKGYPDIILKSIFGTLKAIANEKKLDTEIIHNSLDAHEEGIIIPKINTAVINIPDYNSTDFDIHSLFDNEKLDNIKKYISRAHNHFARALIIHDEWEKYYIDNTDFSKLEQLAKNFIAENIPVNENAEKTKIKQRFLGSATASGAFDYIDDITKDVKRRFFIKGRPGSGKSTFLKAIAKALCENGYDAECYYCAFDPKSVDMVVSRTLDFAVFDSTPPHEHFPDRENDEIIDFYTIAIKPDTDLKYKEQLSEIAGKYKQEMDFAKIDLSVAKEYWDKLQSIRLSAVNYDKLKDEEERIRKKVFE